MTKFIKNIILYFTLLWFAAWGLQTMINNGLKKQQNNLYKDWNLLFSGKLNQDIIVLGSSRAWTHYNPKIIEDSTGLSCYNLGIDGGMLLMQYAKWKSFLMHNTTPKYLILDVNFWSLGKRANLFQKEQFLPYLNEKEITDNLKQIDDKLVWEANIPLFRYHGYTNLVISGLKAFFNIKINDHYSKYNGFAYKTRKWNNNFSAFKKMIENNEADEFLSFFNIQENNKIALDTTNWNLGFNIINQIVNDCKNNKINLILVHSPMYFRLLDLMSQQKEFISSVEKLANSHHIEFWNYLNDTIYHQNNCFEDLLHLNQIGAEEFSINLGKKLHKHIKSQP